MPSKQSFWDQPGILEDRSTIQASLVDQSQMACYLASVAPHSGEWLLALPIANCGLRLEDEAVAYGWLLALWLGLTLCVPHKCHCGSDVNAQGRHAMVCKKAPGRVARHQVLNDINRQNGKRPDGLSQIPWQSGKLLLWDVTVASTLAGSYVDTAATGADLVADQAADRKTAKYADLRAQYDFQPLSVDNLGPFSSSTLDFLRDLGRRISHISGDDREVLFLFQRISVTIQRFNSVLCMIPSQSTDRTTCHFAGFYLLFITLKIFTTKGIKNNNNNNRVYYPQFIRNVWKIFAPYS